MIAALVVLAVLLVGGLAVGAVALAARSRRAFAAGNEVVPGTPTRAPASWAGSHDPEARLHRRLRDAMTALRANDSFDDDGALLDLRVELEQHALALDDQLVAAAALRPELRSGPLTQVGDAVAAIEATIAELATRSTTGGAEALQAALARARERTSLVEQIRAQLDRLPAEGPQPQPQSQPQVQPRPQVQPPIPTAPAGDPPPTTSPPTAPDPPVATDPGPTPPA